MNEQELIKAVEKMNAEYIDLMESDIYHLGLRYKHIAECLPLHAISLLKGHCSTIRTKRKVDAISKYVSRDELYYASPEDEYIKGNVYTCITNGYDIPYEPIIRDENLDYVVFCDDTVSLDGTSAWHIKRIKEKALSNGTNITNRYYKFHPFELFDNASFSMYIDGNVQLFSNVSTLFTVARKSRTGIAMHRHATQNCAYKNALWCEYNHRGDIRHIKEQMERYKKEGFPSEYGLLEATVIITDLSNPVAKNIMDEWWEEYCRTQSGRDQLSLPYVLWRNGITVDEIGDLGNDEYHNPKFRIRQHIGKLF